MRVVFDVPLYSTGLGLQNWQPSPAQLATMTEAMMQGPPIDWSLLQNRWPLGWPERKPLDERFADFKRRLAEARVG